VNVVQVKPYFKPCGRRSFRRYCRNRSHLWARGVLARSSSRTERPGCYLEVGDTGFDRRTPGWDVDVEEVIKTASARSGRVGRRAAPATGKSRRCRVEKRDVMLRHNGRLPGFRRRRRKKPRRLVSRADAQRIILVGSTRRRSRKSRRGNRRRQFGGARNPELSVYSRPELPGLRLAVRLGERHEKSSETYPADVLAALVPFRRCGQRGCTDGYVAPHVRADTAARVIPPAAGVGRQIDWHSASLSPRRSRRDPSGPMTVNAEGMSTGSERILRHLALRRSESSSSAAWRPCRITVAEALTDTTRGPLWSGWGADAGNSRFSRLLPAVWLPRTCRN